MTIQLLFLFHSQIENNIFAVLQQPKRIVHLTLETITILILWLNKKRIKLKVINAINWLNGFVFNDENDKFWKSLIKRFDVPILILKKNIDSSIFYWSLSNLLMTIFRLSRSQISNLCKISYLKNMLAINLIFKNAQMYIALVFPLLFWLSSKVILH